MGSQSAEKENRQYYRPIDGVRAICVLLVMLNHLKIDQSLISYVHGYIGVDIFFIISGFLITDILLREEKAGGIRLSAFYLRRIFRIIPVYSVVLLIYVVICQLPSQAEKWTELKGGMPYFLLFMNEYVKEPNNGTVFGQTWSLGIEEKFYLVWPLAFFFITQRVWMRFLIVGVLFALTGLLPFVLAKSYYGLLVGCVMAILFASGFSGTYAAFLRRIPSWLMLSILLFGFGLELWNQRLTFLLSWIVVLFLSYTIVADTWISSALSSRMMIWLGRRSYSMYLIHALALNVFERFVPLTNLVRGMGVIIASYAVSALGAHVLYITVEEPSRIFGKRLAGRMKRPREILQRN